LIPAWRFGAPGPAADMDRRTGVVPDRSYGREIDFATADMLRVHVIAAAAKAGTPHP